MGSRGTMRSRSWTVKVDRGSAARSRTLAQLEAGRTEAGRTEAESTEAESTEAGHTEAGHTEAGHSEGRSGGVRKLNRQTKWLGEGTVRFAESGTAGDSGRVLLEGPGFLAGVESAASCSTKTKGI